MELCSEAHSYSTRENAIKQLDKALALIGRTRADSRWMIVANAAGRFVPVIVPGVEAATFLGLVHHKIAVVG